jgi:uncharacterized protein YnzC (UPF0291/DUF896 family)
MGRDYLRDGGMIYIPGGDPLLPRTEESYKDELIQVFEGEENLKDFLAELGVEKYRAAYDWLEKEQIKTRSDYLSFWKKTVEEDLEIIAIRSEMRKGDITKDRAKAKIQNMVINQFPRTGWERLHYYLEAIDAEPDPFPLNMTNIETHYLMMRLKTESVRTYNAMKIAINTLKIIEFDDLYFNFKIKANLVGLFFKEGGFTEWKTIIQYIKINGKILTTDNTLKNAKEGKDISEWLGLKEQLFE